jgi:hypothetical protein
VREDFAVAKNKVGISFAIDQQQFGKLLTRLKELESKAARKAIRQGVNEVSKLVLAEARALVPRRSGQLAKSLGRKVKAFRDGRGVYAVVKPRSGVWVRAAPGITGVRSRFSKSGKKSTFVKKFRVEFGGKTIDPVKYAHLVEYGRRQVLLKAKKVLADGTVIYGRKVRSVAPRPFLRPAWERYRTQAPRIIHGYVMRAMLQQWLKRR